MWDKKIKIIWNSYVILENRNCLKFLCHIRNLKFLCHIREGKFLSFMRKTCTYVLPTMRKTCMLLRDHQRTVKGPSVEWPSVEWLSVECPNFCWNNLCFLYSRSRSSNRFTPFCFISKKKLFAWYIMNISHKLCDRMDGTQL